MHEGEVRIDADLVARLVADQFPALAHLPVTEVRSIGTVNAVYRLGDEVYARLPRVAHWASDLEREQRWLPWLAPQLPLDVPEPVASGRPDAVYPFPWAIYRWLEGEPYADDRVTDERQAARDLASFVRELRRVDPTDAPPAGRRPLRVLDEGTRDAIEASRTVIDADAALAAWDDTLRAAPWTGDPVWIHTDLLRPNILTRAGLISAVIDFGGAGIGDPAADVVAAWATFGPAGRATYRAELDVDDDTWRRARGFALHQAAMIIPYYAETNPAFVALAARTVEQVLLDQAASSG
jgi:aminoglycoside phosphotransferase (APT) family kinase protein